MTTAEALLQALAGGHEEEAWKLGRALAEAVLHDEKNVLAQAVLDAGPFAMRRAEELAELVLAGARDAVADPHHEEPKRS
jgi:hypothetical protein